MKLQNSETKDNLINRLRRIEGQIRGVQEMLSEERDCREIMQQLAAAHSAVQSTSREFFRHYAAVCMAEMGQETDGEKTSQQRERMVEELITLLDKTP